MYIQDNPGNLNSEGKQKTVQVRGNVSFGGKFQWTFDKGNGNLVQISKDLKLSEFELSGFYCIIINYYYPIIGQSGWKVLVICWICWEPRRLHGQTILANLEWCLRCRQVISVQLKSSQFILQRMVTQTPKSRQTVKSR